MNLLGTDIKNDVLHSVKQQISERRQDIIKANAKDLDAWHGSDQAMYDRLIVNDKKVEGMIKAVEDIISDTDPVGRVLYRYRHPNDMLVINKTAPFGTILIIYESRPDVTIEAAMVAFKSNNRILLKGGKEAIHSNKVLVECWHHALTTHGLDMSWVTLLEMDRSETQAFLKSPDRPLDLIVPRGGDGLIAFVRAHATCPVLISGRGNNFLYVHDDADWDQSISVIVNAKIDKISACNALDKVLINRRLPDLQTKLPKLLRKLEQVEVKTFVDEELKENTQGTAFTPTDMNNEWDKEYLAMKIAVAPVDGIDQAIELINEHSGGHSATIMTLDAPSAERFMNEVDAAAVYHNASTRFTDGGQFGLGAELAISTDKLHHRGPLGLHQLVTNKWYVFGDGQIR